MQIKHSPVLTPNCVWKLDLANNRAWVKRDPDGLRCERFMHDSMEAELHQAHSRGAQESVPQSLLMPIAEVLSVPQSLLKGLVHRIHT